MDDMDFKSDAVLAILSGRSWGMRINQITADQLWLTVAATQPRWARVEGWLLFLRDAGLVELTPTGGWMLTAVGRNRAEPLARKAAEMIKAEGEW